MKGILTGGFLGLFIMFALSFHAFGQSDPKDSEIYKVNWAVYHKAMKYNDVGVARDALYKLIEIAPNDFSLLDSLAFLYFEYRQYASTALVCKDILSRRPKHPPALEMGAVSFENLGLNDQALLNYESLFLIENNIVTLYKIAYLQYELKRYAEFQNNAETLIKNEKTLEVKLIFSGEDNKQQEIPMRAAVYNFKGLIAQENGDKAKALQNYEEALKLAPDFYLAKISKKSLED